MANMASMAMMGEAWEAWATAEQACAARVATTAALGRLQRAQVAEARRIRQVVAWYYNFTAAQLTQRGRRRELAEARQVAMYLMRTDLRWPTRAGNERFPLERIGRLLARDHSTVLHGVAVIDARAASEGTMRATLGAIRAELERLEDEEDEEGGR